MAGVDPELLEAGLVEGDPAEVAAGVLDAEDVRVRGQGLHRLEGRSTLVFWGTW